MFQDKYIFSQLIAFLNRTQFNNYVRKYNGNRYVKYFTYRNQMLAMMFGQLGNREGLRDLKVAFEAHRAKQYYLGLGREPIAKTTLATANQNRDYRIFEDFAFYMMKEACEKRTINILDISGKTYLHLLNKVKHTGHKKRLSVSRQPIFTNLKSNTMKTSRR